MSNSGLEAQPRPVHMDDDTVVLHLKLPRLPFQSKQAIHIAYVRPDLKTTSPSSARSLYVSNTPIDATESQIRSLFADQLGGFRVAAVEFVEARSSSTRNRENPVASASLGRKRKRGGIAEAGDYCTNPVLDLPSTWDREVLKSGSSAVVVFADQASVEGAMRAVKRFARKRSALDWRTDVGEHCPLLGSQRKSPPAALAR